MSQWTRRKRDLVRPRLGYHCPGCQEVFTIVRIEPGPAVLPSEVGCPFCWADLVPVRIFVMGSRSFWLPLVGRGADLLGKGPDAPGSDAVT